MSHDTAQPMKATLHRPINAVFVAVVFLAGAAAVVSSVGVLSRPAVGYSWLVLAVLTWVSGSFAIKVPAVPATISVSETFVFLLILLFGPESATLTVAVDGLVTSLHRRNHQPRRVLFNFGEPAVSVWISARLYYWISGNPPLSVAPGQLDNFVWPVLLLALFYFLLNGWLTAVAVATDTGTAPHRVWQKHYLLLALNYFGGASIALLIAANMRSVNLSSLSIAVPLLVVLYLTFRTWMARIDDANHHLSELNKLYLATVESLAMAIDAKDQVTHGHIRRVQTYALRLAQAAGVKDQLEIKAIETAALLHDMGKLAVPDYILNKPGKLTASEYEQMKLHASVGADILSAVNFPYPVVPIVRHHHENWDGTGYPDGLKALEIPIGARILSVIDCYDALRSDRPYRRALAEDEALSIIKDRRGKMYDPAVVDAFCELHKDLRDTEPVLPHETSVLVPILRAARERKSKPPRPISEQLRSSLAEEVLRLCDLTEALAGHATLDDTGEMIARHLKRLVPASLVTFYVPDQRSECLVVAHASGNGALQLSDLTVPLDHGLSGWVAANRSTIMNSDPNLDLRGCLDALSPALRSALVTALVVDDSLVGVIALYGSEANIFTEAHRQFIELLAPQIAMTIQRVGRLERERAGMLRDPLTGLPNGRYLSQLLTSGGFSESQMLRSIGVLYLGIGGLDDEAKPSADRVVMQAAAATCQSTRVADIVFRTGEHELLVLMPDCDVAGGELVANRIAGHFESENQGPEAAAFDLGFACAPLDGDTLNELIDAARGRMLRNRRILAEAATRRRARSDQEPALALVALESTPQ